MATYINFFPGNTREGRELSVSHDELYGRQDLEVFVDSMLRGCTASTPAAGLRERMSGAADWQDLRSEFGDQAVDDALTEIAQVVPGLEYVAQVRDA